MKVIPEPWKMAMLAAAMVCAACASSTTPSVPVASAVEPSSTTVDAPTGSNMLRRTNRTSPVAVTSKDAVQDQIRGSSRNSSAATGP